MSKDKDAPEPINPLNPSDSISNLGIALSATSAMHKCLENTNFELLNLPANLSAPLAMTTTCPNGDPKTVVISLKIFDTHNPDEITQQLKRGAPRPFYRDNTNWEFLRENAIDLPTRTALVEIMNAENLKPQHLCEQTGSDRKTVNCWLSKVGTQSARRMPLGIWELFLLKTGRHPTKKLVDK